jgi:hypothetical protein
VAFPDACFALRRQFVPQPLRAGASGAGSGPEFAVGLDLRTALGARPGQLLRLVARLGLLPV